MTPDDKPVSGADVGKPPCRPHGIEDRSRLAVADQIGVDFRRSEPGIVCRRDGVAPLEYGREPRYGTEEHPREGGSAAAHNARRRMRPGDDGPALARRRAARHDHHAGYLDGLVGEPGRPIENTVGLAAVRSARHRLGADKRAKTPGFRRYAGRRERRYDQHCAGDRASKVAHDLPRHERDYAVAGSQGDSTAQLYATPFARSILYVCG